MQTTMDRLSRETVPDWRDDGAVIAATVAERDLNQRQATLYEQYNQLWQSAQRPGAEVPRPPLPGHPCWEARHHFQLAEADWLAAQAELVKAEGAAKARLQAAGERAGIAHWHTFEREVLPKLIHWSDEYARLRQEVQVKTGVLLPDVTQAVCLESSSLKIFSENVRRAMGIE